jgi:hypothetical protein
MKHGYTQTEAEALINQLFETRESLGCVPRQMRGRVIKALDAGDHWNVLIEWELPHLSAQVWYDKYDVQHSMRPLQQDGDPGAVGGEMQILEIRSSHDLAAKSADARRTGPHSYQVNCREFTSMLRAWEQDRVQRTGPLSLMTLSLQRIWITAGESRQVMAAIEATRSPVTLD